MNRNLILFIITFGCLCGFSTGTTLAENVTSSGDGLKKLSRQKRYMAFPEGSSFSVAYCGTFGYIGNPNYIYISWALNYGIAYELPNETFVINHQHLTKHKPKPEILRRHRRELYNKLEVAIDNMGYNGRQCILRALCESTQYFNSKGSNMVEELVRTVFTLPRTKVLSFEHNTIQEYDHGPSERKK
ncbi:hypothetical protein HA402_007511 [Bradysia odoriphaga]|nr:hypothetical protein HA402_007511 [Bradysia odoriphaga]